MEPIAPPPFPPKHRERMKRIRCPKCDEPILFDEKQYEAGRTLVFECKACHKRFKVRLKRPAESEEEAAEGPEQLGYLTVIENAFHLKQHIALVEGDNVVGRHVPGTSANAAIKTVDPSVDTTHCIISAHRDRTTGDVRFTVRDAQSNTGTFLSNTIIPDRCRMNIEDGAIITIGATTMILHEGTEEE